MLKIYLSIRWRDVLILLAIMLFVGGGITLYRTTYGNADFEIVDALGGNIFPSAILSVATTDVEIVEPVDTPYVGNPKSLIGIKVRSRGKNSRIRIEVEPTPFYARSVSEFVLPRHRTDYIVYPDIAWDYDALRNNQQAEPISVIATVTLNEEEMGKRVRTFSMRSVNECLLGYMKPVGKGSKFISTRLLFAAYVNEENPMIDKVLREALNTRIVNRFQGYQGDSAQVVRQVYALWNVLQRREFKYSSISNSSLSSNVVFAQRVRTFDDALASSQINCVDGSVLFASLLRAINIDPVLVRIPGHMFVGFYTDNKHSHIKFLETTMIGDINLDDYFPAEQLDSTMLGKSRSAMSRLTFDKSMEYATVRYERNRNKLLNNSSGYMFLEISKGVRSQIQSIGK